jgi:hypothetical protein
VPSMLPEVVPLPLREPTTQSARALSQLSRAAVCDSSAWRICSSNFTNSSCSRHQIGFVMALASPTLIARFRNRSCSQVGTVTTVTWSWSRHPRGSAPALCAGARSCHDEVLEWAQPNPHHSERRRRKWCCGERQLHRRNARKPYHRGDFTRILGNPRRDSSAEEESGVVGKEQVVTPWKARGEHRRGASTLSLVLVRRKGG